MKTILSHGRKNEILIGIDINAFASMYFDIFTKRLTESYIFNHKRSANKLEFKGSNFRFVWNGWDLFNTLSSGEIEFTLEDNKPFIRHQVKFTEVFIIALLFTIIPLFTLNYDPSWSLYTFIAIWLAYFTTYLVSVYRINSYITEVLIEVNKNTMPAAPVSKEGLG
ncbi:MAG: hypothetical protein U0W24_13585 [Bacteroidales bacterium]